jgi:DNA-binding NarL/FixJ family response regulator
MEVVGEAGDGRAALEALAVTRADLVLMDVRMPRLDGVRTTERLLADAPADRPPPRVVVLTTFDLDEYVFAALRAGASGFLLKDAHPDELLGAIRAVLSGDAVVAPSATRRLLDHVAGALPGAGGGEDPRLEALTPREREVLLEVARGRTNAEIAAGLHMAEATVKTHIGRLLSKLDQRDRVQLAVLAYETGLVRAGG